jgi:hypothetical protein
MRSTFPLAAVLATWLALSGAPALAQAIPPGTRPPVGASGATAEGLEADGRVAAVDPAARTLRFEGGTEYVVPDTVPFDWASVRVGSLVKLRYSIDQGRNLVTAVQVLFR